MSETLLYQVALKKLDGIGPARAKKLVAYCGGVREVFEASQKQLISAPGINKGVVSGLNRDEALRQAEAEIRFIEKEHIRPLFYLDPAYPTRLKHCDDGPILLYSRGETDLNTQKVVSVVGTRNATAYGKRITEQLVEGLKPHGALIVSGLALGVDIIAHRTALACGLPTAGVLGHSLDRIYPHQHKSTAEKMTTQGTLLSEFESGTKPDRENFPMRNRIVAGMSDVTVIIETAVRGGSMITATQAAGYHRDVMAFPGPVDAIYSSGCNHLIKTNQAALIEGIEDLEYIMGWEREPGKEKPVQKQMFVELNEHEKQLYGLLQQNPKESIDNLSLNSGLPMSKTSTLLLEMEFKGVVKALPGKMYSLT